MESSELGETINTNFEYADSLISLLGINTPINERSSLIQYLYTIFHQYQIDTDESMGLNPIKTQYFEDWLLELSIFVEDARSNQVDQDDVKANLLVFKTQYQEVLEFQGKTKIQTWNLFQLDEEKRFDFQLEFENAKIFLNTYLMPLLRTDKGAFISEPRYLEILLVFLFSYAHHSFLWLSKAFIGHIFNMDPTSKKLDDRLQRFLQNGILELFKREIHRTGDGQIWGTEIPPNAFFLHEQDQEFYKLVNPLTFLHSLLILLSYDLTLRLKNDYPLSVLEPFLPLPEYYSLMKEYCQLLQKKLVWGQKIYENQGGIILKNRELQIITNINFTSLEFKKRYGWKTITTQILTEMLQQGDHIILEGSLGIGKSVLLRNLVFSQIESVLILLSTKIPIYINQLEQGFETTLDIIKNSIKQVFFERISPEDKKLMELKINRWITHLVLKKNYILYLDGADNYLKDSNQVINQKLNLFREILTTESQYGLILASRSWFAKDILYAYEPHFQTSVKKKLHYCLLSEYTKREVEFFARSVYTKRKNLLPDLEIDRIDSELILELVSDQLYKNPLFLWGIINVDSILWQKEELNDLLLRIFFCWFYAKGILDVLNLQFVNITSQNIMINNKQIHLSVQTYYTFFKNMFSIISKELLKKDSTLTISFVHELVTNELNSYHPSVISGILEVWEESVLDPAFLLSLDRTTGQNYILNSIYMNEFLPELNKKRKDA